MLLPEENLYGRAGISGLILSCFPTTFEIMYLVTFWCLPVIEWDQIISMSEMALMKLIIFSPGEYTPNPHTVCFAPFVCWYDEMIIGQLLGLCGKKRYSKEHELFVQAIPKEALSDCPFFECGHLLKRFLNACLIFGTKQHQLVNVHQIFGSK